jgi:riboflavin kinase, archaea type
MRLTGKVESGQGSFSYWMKRLEQHYRRLTGVNLYPGTLNVRLAEPFHLCGDVRRLEAAQYGGDVSVSALACRVGGLSAFVLRTDANAQGRGDHPLEVVELAAAVRLRDALGLVDGDEVTVEICPWSDPSGSKPPPD